MTGKGYGVSDRRGVELSDVSARELEAARAAYRGALQSSRAWRAFTDVSRHHDVTYWSLLVTLFIEPGLNRMTLIDRVMEEAAVSRSTAERAIKEAREHGYIRDQAVGKEVRFVLSDRLADHCIGFFRAFMDPTRSASVAPDD